ncbi:hypothetical protein P9112_001736 [Eukaryota sp. TZLM1-RC]
MAQTARISCIKEPLLKETLSLNNFGSDDRGDVYCHWIDNSEAIVGFVSCYVANDTLVHRRKLNPVSALDFKAKEKHRKYDKDIEEANVDRNTQLVENTILFCQNNLLKFLPVLLFTIISKSSKKRKAVGASEPKRENTNGYKLYFACCRPANLDKGSLYFLNLRFSAVERGL